MFTEQRCLKSQILLMQHFSLHLIPIKRLFSLRLFNAFSWFDVQTAECINLMLLLLALSSQKPLFSCSAWKHQYFTPGLKDGVKM